MSIWDKPYNQLAFKASHNSYMSKYSIHDLLRWNRDDPSQFGCRGLEIDFTRHSDSSGGTSVNFFQVTHDVGGSGEPLAEYLGYMLSYHVNHRQHDPIFVTLCIKSEDGEIRTFPEEMDAYLREWFYVPAIFSPGSMLMPGQDLVTSVGERGWPAAKELRDRFVFCLSGTEKWKCFYAQSSPAERLCFADMDISDNQPNPPIATKGDRIVANMNLFSDHYPLWRTAISELHTAGFLVRGYVVNSAELWGKARSANLNVIATDDVAGHAWATVGDAPFA
jgi:hypothetical protein